MLKKILAARGIHYILSRFGPRKLRSLTFDAKYTAGDWRFQGVDDAPLARVIARYLKGGDLLILGCGGASIIDYLKPLEFRYITGIDLSSEAVRLANRHASAAIKFEVGDMTAFRTDISYDVILFSESIYYISVGRQEQLLRRLSNQLKPDGAFIVTIAQPDRYASHLSSIRSSFRALEDYPVAHSRRHLIAFRGYYSSLDCSSGK